MNSHQELQQLKLLLEKLNREPEKNALAINSIDMEIDSLEDEISGSGQNVPEGWSTR